MKKLFLTVAVAAMAAVSASAQEMQEVQETRNEQPAAPKENAEVYRHEFFAGTGLVPVHNLSSIPRFIAAVLTFGAFDEVETNLRYKPSAAAGYKYRFDRVVSLGATFSYSGNTADSEWLWKKESQKCRLNRDYYALAAEIEFRWLTREHVTLYSAVGLGAAYSHTVRTADTGERDVRRKTICTAHISEIGVKVGGRRFGGYLEGGLGYKGVVSLGTYARF